MAGQGSGHHAGNAGRRSVRYDLNSTWFKCYLSLELVTGEPLEFCVASPCTWSSPLHCAGHEKICGHFCHPTCAQEPPVGLLSLLLLCFLTSLSLWASFIMACYGHPPLGFLGSTWPFSIQQGEHSKCMPFDLERLCGSSVHSPSLQSVRRQMTTESAGSKTVNVRHLVGS